MILMESNEKPLHSGFKVRVCVHYTEYMCVWAALFPLINSKLEWIYLQRISMPAFKLCSVWNFL